MVAKAKIRIDGEDATAAAWSSALGRANKTATQMTGVFNAAFASISAASIGKALAEKFELGDTLNKARIAAHLTAQEISTLAYAGKLADVELSTLTTSISKMQIFLSKANSGVKENVETLSALGLSTKKFTDLNADQRLELFAEQISHLGREEDKTRAIQDVFGKGGQALRPMFEEGAAGIRQAREEAERLGLVFDEKTLARLSAADDATKRLSATWEHFGVIMASKVGPYLTKAMDFWAGMPTATSERIADLEDLLKPRRGMTAQEKSRLQAELALAKLKLQHETALEMGLQTPAAVSPGHGGAYLASAPESSNTPPGFHPDLTAQLAAEKKQQEKLNDQYRDMVLDLNREIDKSADAELEADKGREAERLDMADEWYEKWIENEKKLAQYRDEQAHKLSEGAQIWKDAFLNAFDDMVNTGKIKWDELLKYLVAEFTRRGVSKLFDDMFSGNQSSGGGGGFWGSLASGIIGAFGGSSGVDTSTESWINDFAGGRAKGGDVDAGRTYLVGEEGPELLVPHTAGKIISNGGSDLSLPGLAPSIDASRNQLSNTHNNQRISLNPIYNISMNSGAVTHLELRRVMESNNQYMFQHLIDHFDRVHNIGKN